MKNRIALNVMAISLIITLNTVGQTIYPPLPVVPVQPVPIKPVPSPIRPIGPEPEPIPTPTPPQPPQPVPIIPQR